MQITSLSGLYQANFLADPERTEKRNRMLSSNGDKGDTVTFSEEALSLAGAMSPRKAPAAESGTDADGSAENDFSDEKDVFGKSGMAVCVNGKMSSEEELYAEIHKVEKEVKELGEKFMEIMGGSESIEEKARLSQPVHKRLQERLQDLQGLKAQAKALEESKTAESQSQGSSTRS